MTSPNPKPALTSLSGARQLMVGRTFGLKPSRQNKKKTSYSWRRKSYSKEAVSCMYRATMVGSRCKTTYRNLRSPRQAVHEITKTPWLRRWARSTSRGSGRQCSHAGGPYCEGLNKSTRHQHYGHILLM